MKQLILLLLILVPAAIYVVYGLMSRPAGERLRKAPWGWLLAGGILLYGVGMAVWSLTIAPPGSEYVPPRLIDGQIEPSQHVPDPAEGDGGTAGDDGDGN